MKRYVCRKKYEIVDHDVKIEINADQLYQKTFEKEQKFLNWELKNSERLSDTSHDTAYHSFDNSFRIYQTQTKKPYKFSSKIAEEYYNMHNCDRYNNCKHKNDFLTPNIISTYK